MISTFTGICGPNTVLAQALFTSQAALAAVPGEVLGSVDEIENFVTALGVFTTHLPVGNIASQFERGVDGVGDKRGVSTRLFDGIRLLKRTVARRSDSRVLSQKVEMLRSILIQEIPDNFYNATAERSIRFAMEVFG